jgi:NTP pyrophosphatase (non-canonical NTP hydrolase)
MKPDMQELIEAVKQWGRDKGITGPNGRGTLLGQLAKTQEELTETRDAAVFVASKHKYFWNQKGYAVNSMDELADGIGDTTVTVILAAEMAGLDFTECLATAYDEIKSRKGSMKNGVFVKEEQP